MSTVQLAVALGLVLPAWSVCRTVRECAPSGSELSVVGLTQGLNGPPSIEQERTALVSPVIAIDAPVRLVNGVGVPRRVGAAGELVSTLQVTTVGVLEMPDSFFWTIERLCVPSLRRVSLRGLVQAAGLPPSSEQVNVAFASPVKEIVAEVSFVNAAGAPPVTVGGCGALASTVHVAVAGWLVFPALSVCLIAND